MATPDDGDNDSPNEVCKVYTAGKAWSLRGSMLWSDRETADIDKYKYVYSYRSSLKALEEILTRIKCHMRYHKILVTSDQNHSGGSLTKQQSRGELKLLIAVTMKITCAGQYENGYQINGQSLETSWL